MRQSAPPPKSGWRGTNRVCVSCPHPRYDGNNPGKMTTRLDRFLAYSESRRLTVCVVAGLLTAGIAWADWQLPDTSTGFFVTALNQRRRNLADYLAERERQIRLRQEAEQQVRILIETSPLAILTLDHLGRVALANESARELFGFEDESLPGSDVAPYLPILYRMLKNARATSNLRTNVECKAQRRNGEVFLAHVWLSTYHTSQGAGMAAVVWDASENLRDREGSGFD